MKHHCGIATPCHPQSDPPLQPGSAQVLRLVAQLGAVHLSPGVVVKEARERKTPLGKADLPTLPTPFTLSVPPPLCPMALAP